MATILITGGCGFIGSNLALAFRKRGDRVVALDNLSRRGSEILRERILQAGAEFVRGDIRTPADFDHRLGFELGFFAEPGSLTATQNNNFHGLASCFQI